MLFTYMESQHSKTSSPSPKERGEGGYLGEAAPPERKVAPAFL